MTALSVHGSPAHDPERTELADLLSAQSQPAQDLFGVFTQLGWASTQREPYAVDLEW